MEFVSEITDVIGTIADGNNVFLDAYYSSELADNDDLNSAVYTAREIEKLFNISIPENVILGKPNDMAVIRKLTEHMFDNNDSIHCSTNIVDVLNSGFGTCAKTLISDANVTCFTSSEQETKLLERQFGSSIIVQELENGPFKDPLQDKHYQFVMIDLTCDNSAVVPSSAFGMMRFDKTKKYLKAYNSDVDAKKIPNNIKHTQQFYEMEKKEKEFSSAALAEKISLKKCNYAIRFIASNYTTDTQIAAAADGEDKPIAKKASPLKLNNYEACGIALAMALLDTPGTAVVLIKTCNLNQASNKDIRTALLEKYNVTEVIQVSPRTTALIFSIVDGTNAATTNVAFKEFVYNTNETDLFVDDEDGSVVLSGIKGELNHITVQDVETINISDIAMNDYQLVYAPYKLYRIIQSDNYVICSIDKIATVSMGKHSNEFNRDTGEFRFVMKDSIGTCDVADYPNGGVVIRDESTVEFIEEGFSCSAGCVVLTIFPELMDNLKIAFFVILSHIENIFQNRKLTVAGISRVEIPVPNPKNTNCMTKWINPLFKEYQKNPNSSKITKDLAAFKQENSIN